VSSLVVSSIVSAFALSSSVAGVIAIVIALSNPTITGSSFQPTSIT